MRITPDADWRVRGMTARKSEIFGTVHEDYWILIRERHGDCVLDWNTGFKIELKVEKEKKTSRKTPKVEVPTYPFRIDQLDQIFLAIRL